MALARRIAAGSIPIFLIACQRNSHNLLASMASSACRVAVFARRATSYVPYACSRRGVTSTVATTARAFTSTPASWSTSNQTAGVTGVVVPKPKSPAGAGATPVRSAAKDITDSQDSMSFIDKVCMPARARVCTTTTAAAATNNANKRHNACWCCLLQAKQLGASALLGAFTHMSTRFDACLQDLDIVSVDSDAGTVTCEVLVTEKLQNAYGSMHGGAIATAVDVVGTLALLTKDPTKAGVSVDLSVRYTSSAKAGDTVVIVGR